MEDAKSSMANENSQNTKKRVALLIIFVIIAAILGAIAYTYKKNADNQSVIESITSLIESGDIKKVQEEINALSDNSYYTIAVDTAKSLLNIYIEQFYNQIEEYLTAVLNNDSENAYTKSTWTHEQHPSFSLSEFKNKFKNNELSIQQVIKNNSRFKINPDKKFSLENNEVIVMVDYNFDSSPMYKNRHIKSYKLSLTVDKYTGIIFDEIKSEALGYFRDEDNELASKRINNLLEERKINEAYKLYREISKEKFYYSNLSELKKNIFDTANYIAEHYGVELTNDCLDYYSIQGDAKGDVYTFKMKVENSSPLFEIQSDICIEFVGSQNFTGKKHSGKMCQNISLSPGEGVVLSEKIDDNRHRRKYAMDQAFDALFGALMGNTIGKIITVKIHKIGKVSHKNLTIKTIDF